MTPDHLTARGLRLLLDTSNADPFERAMASHQAMNDALAADLFGIGAGRQAGFDRLDAMRRRLLED